jgi:hypothetical protein
LRKVSVIVGVEDDNMVPAGVLNEIHMGFRGVEDVQLEFVVVKRVPGSAVDLAPTTGEFVAIFDATGGYDPKDVQRVLAPLLSGEADVVLGRESGAGVSLREKATQFLFGNSVLGLVAGWLFRTSFGGDQTGLRAFRREALGLPARALRVVEVPVSHQESAVPP